jgi:hypothetical protein
LMLSLEREQQKTLDGEEFDLRKFLNFWTSVKGVFIEVICPVFPLQKINKNALNASSKVEKFP